MTMLSVAERALRDLLGDDNPVFRHAQETKARRDREAYQALGAQIAAAERERNEKLPALNKAQDATFSKVKKLREQLSAAEHEYDGARRARTAFLSGIDRRLQAGRTAIRQLADPKITETARAIEALLERWTSNAANPYETDSRVMWQGIRSVNVVVATNYQAVHRRVEALNHARRELDELAHSYVENVDDAIAAIMAKVPNGLDPVTPMEKVELPGNVSAA